MELRPPHELFYLQSMEDIYRQAEGKPDEPHRHAYYTVLLVAKASGEHQVDYQPYELAEKQVFFVAPGQVHQVIADPTPDGWVITFSRDFLTTNNIPESFITNLTLFRAFGDSPPLELEQATFQRLQSLIVEMKACLPEQLPYRYRALGALLQLFLIYCNHSRTFDPQQLDEEHKGVCLLRDFKSLVDERFSQWHKVNDYASQINITPKHLSHSVKALTGKTAKEHIQDRLILEARRMLLHTDLTVKQIGYELGFEEPLHFSSFFKKQVGQSPTDFRLRPDAISA